MDSFGSGPAFCPQVTDRAALSSGPRDTRWAHGAGGAVTADGPFESSLWTEEEEVKKFVVLVLRL